jgi:putative transcriptional regulator
LPQPIHYPGFELFEWGALKSARTAEHRGFDFAFASRVFLGPFLSREDMRTDYGERRFVAPHPDKRGECIVSIVRRKRSEIGRGLVDRAKVRAATEKQIEEWKREDGIVGSQLGPVRRVPGIDVLSLRERLGLSQVVFARRYRLSLRTLQEWEQHRREPSESARVLLYAISRNPKALARALSRE